MYKLGLFLNSLFSFIESICSYLYQSKLFWLMYFIQSLEVRKRKSSKSIFAKIVLDHLNTFYLHTQFRITLWNSTKNITKILMGLYWIQRTPWNIWNLSNIKSCNLLMYLCIYLNILSFIFSKVFIVFCL